MIEKYDAGNKVIVEAFSAKGLERLMEASPNRQFLIIQEIHIYDEAWFYKLGKILSVAMSLLPRINIPPLQAAIFAIFVIMKDWMEVDIADET